MVGGLPPPERSGIVPSRLRNSGSHPIRSPSVSRDPSGSRLLNSASQSISGRLCGPASCSRSSHRSSRPSCLVPPPMTGQGRGLHRIRARSVRIFGWAPLVPVRAWAVGSAYDERSLPLAGAARNARGMGQPPPTTRHRVPPGGEPRPQGAAEGAPPPADRRPAPTPRREGPPPRSPGLAAGRDHRDPRHDPAMAPTADRPEVDVHADAARPSPDHAGDLVADSPDGHGESGVGLHADSGSAEEPGPRRGQEYGRQGLKAHGIPPAPDRPSSWRTFLRAHWGAIAGADFFTTEVWTPRGLITYYTLFVIIMRSRWRPHGCASLTGLLAELLHVGDHALGRTEPQTARPVP